MTKKIKTRTPVTTYVRIGTHMYFDGHSFRVRRIINGEKITKSFKSKMKAFKFRKELLSR